MIYILYILNWMIFTFIYCSASKHRGSKSLSFCPRYDNSCVLLDPVTYCKFSLKNQGRRIMKCFIWEEWELGSLQGLLAMTSSGKKKNVRLLKTMLWLIGQGSVSVNKIFLIIWVLNHRPNSCPVLCLSVISITFIQGVLVSQTGEGRLAKSQERWSKRSMLSVSLERRSMWEQTHVEDVAIGHCCDIPCVVEERMPQRWWSSWWGVFTDRGIAVKAVCQGHPQVCTLHSLIGRLQDDQHVGLNTLSSPLSHLLSVLMIKSVYLESSIHHFF